MTCQVGQYDGAFESLRASRDINARISGEGIRTAVIDVALGTLHRIRGDYKQADQIENMRICTYMYIYV